MAIWSTAFVLRLQYLRGFENVMVDMFDEEPKLFELIEMIDKENLKIVRHYCDAKVDLMEYLKIWEVRIQWLLAETCF